MHSPRVEVTAFMAGCRYSASSSCDVVVLCVVWLLGICLGLLVGARGRRLVYWSSSTSVVCLHEDVFGGVLRYGIKLKAGKVMLMRGGACAAELWLMEVVVSCIWHCFCEAVFSVWCERGFIFRFLVCVCCSCCGRRL